MNHSRVFIDTNVYISALITPGSSRTALRKILMKEYIIITSEYVLSEIEGVGKREKFRRYFTMKTVDHLIRILREHAVITDAGEGIPENYQSTDKKDMPIVASIIAAKPDYFITGNAKDFVVLEDFTHIVSPSEFLQEVVGK